MCDSYFRFGWCNQGNGWRGGSGVGGGGIHDDCSHSGVPSWHLSWTLSGKVLQFPTEEASPFLDALLPFLGYEFSDVSQIGSWSGILSLGEEVEGLVGVVELLSCSI